MPARYLRRTHTSRENIHDTNTDNSSFKMLEMFFVAISSCCVTMIRWIADPLHSFIRRCCWLLWLFPPFTLSHWNHLPFDLKQDPSFVRQTLLPIPLKNFFLGPDFLDDIQLYNKVLDSSPNSYYEVFCAILRDLDMIRDYPSLALVLERTLSLLALHGRPGWPKNEIFVIRFLKYLARMTSGQREWPRCNRKQGDLEGIKIELFRSLARKIDREYGWFHLKLIDIWIKAGLPVFGPPEEPIFPTNSIFVLPRRDFWGCYCGYECTYSFDHLKFIYSSKEKMLLIAEHCSKAYKAGEFMHSKFRGDKLFMKKAVSIDGSLFLCAKKALFDHVDLGLVSFANSKHAIVAYHEARGNRVGLEFFCRLLNHIQVQLAIESFYYIILWSRGHCQHFEPLLWKNIYEYAGIGFPKSQAELVLMHRARNNLLRYLKDTTPSGRGKAWK